jgi:hypothetical protein
MVLHTGIPVDTFVENVASGSAMAEAYRVAAPDLVSGLLYNLRGMILATSIVLFGMFVIAGLHIYGYLVPVSSPLEF